MKHAFFILCAIFMAFNAQAAENYYVNAENGLIVRNAPDGKRVGRIPYGYRITVLAKHDAADIMDNAWLTSGHWVSIDSDIMYMEMDSDAEDYPKKLFVFDGFLTPAKEFVAEKQQLLNQYAPAETGKLATDLDNIAIRGDFFGDGVVDDVLRVRQKNGDIHLVILNHQAAGTKLFKLGGGNDPLDVGSYSFGYVKKVPKGTHLWSNYEDDFRSFKEVPKNEIVTLAYDALYFHEFEACGGGFVFWHNNRWNWLQQE